MWYGKAVRECTQGRTNLEGAQTLLRKYSSGHLIVEKAGACLELLGKE